MTYADRVRELEAEGLTTSDAQGVADAEQLQGRAFDFDPAHPLDSAPGPRLVRLTAAQTAAAVARVEPCEGGFTYWTPRRCAPSFATRKEAEAASVQEWRDNLG